MIFYEYHMIYSDPESPYQQTPYSRLEEDMKSNVWHKDSREDRRSFIGGSDARIIMGDDEAP